jgi:hypothetical protein
VHCTELLNTLYKLYISELLGEDGRGGEDRAVLVVFPYFVLSLFMFFAASPL